MSRITVTKTEYDVLKRQAEAYRKLMSRLFESALRGSVGEVAGDFRATNLYSEGFLRDLEDGLLKSSYHKNHAHKAATK